MVALGKLTEAIMLETLLGGILGGFLRLVPELLKWLDRAGERKHELCMQDKALEFERLRGAGRMAELQATLSEIKAHERDTVAAIFEGVDLDVPHGRSGAFIDTRMPCAWGMIRHEGNVVGIVMLRNN